MTGDGRIVCKHIGPVMPQDLQEKLLPLVRDLKALDPGTRILVLTGYGSIATAVEAIKLDDKLDIYYVDKDACTACGACVEVCPVGNEPMRDILDIRRSLVLMDNQFPAQLQQAFKGMERTGNPWNIAPESRLDWAKGYTVPTIEQNPEPDILWWVGCAPATDARAQKTAQAFAKVLNAAGVNFAVLGKMERCTGDSARRAGTRSSSRAPRGCSSRGTACSRTAARSGPPTAGRGRSSSRPRNAWAISTSPPRDGSWIRLAKLNTA